MAHCSHLEILGQTARRMRSTRSFSPLRTRIPQTQQTPTAGEHTEADLLSITLVNALYYSVALTKIQIWAPSNPGPRYEVEDGLLGTFIGGFEGKKSGLNCMIRNGGVLFGAGGWAEMANVKKPGGGAGSTNLTVTGGGSGILAVQMNLFSNETVVFDGANANKAVESGVPGRQECGDAVPG